MQIPIRYPTRARYHGTLKKIFYYRSTFSLVSFISTYSMHQQKWRFSILYYVGGKHRYLELKWFFFFPFHYIFKDCFDWSYQYLTTSVNSCFIPWSSGSLQKARGRLNKLPEAELTIWLQKRSRFEAVHENKFAAIAAHLFLYLAEDLHYFDAPLQELSQVYLSSTVLR